MGYHDKSRPKHPTRKHRSPNATTRSPHKKNMNMNVRKVTGIAVATGIVIGFIVLQNFL